METDSLFYNLFKKLPRTFFYLLGLPATRARSYRFDSVELKKALRIDGMFLPKSSDLPLYFLEVQYQRTATFYANLFAKVFCYLEENDPAQDWQAVALFENRRAEPTDLIPYRVLLESPHVHRIYLDEYPIPPNPPIGLGILQLLNAPEADLKRLVTNLVERVELDPNLAAGGKAANVIELAEELLMSRFIQFDREEIQKMFNLQDIRKSRVYQEGVEEGIEKGIEKGALLKQEEMVRNCLARGMAPQEIADLFRIPLKEVRRVATDAAK
jgi:predicted transposase/invertase (TIGR01784 family)